jgi:1-acyl-sn-glycerol-3-phosphate acyltransferase
MSFKQALEWIEKGVPIMAFPEGRRSDDGHLLDFKGGPFAIAIKTGVPIVPITLAHTHAVMPSNSLFPVQPGAGKLHVHVHPPISVEGRTDKELEEEVRSAFMSTLPKCQYPVEQRKDEPVPVVTKEEEKVLETVER